MYERTYFHFSYWIYLAIYFIIGLIIMEVPIYIELSLSHLIFRNSLKITMLFESSLNFKYLFWIFQVQVSPYDGHLQMTRYDSAIDREFWEEETLFMKFVWELFFLCFHLIFIKSYINRKWAFSILLYIGIDQTFYFDSIFCLLNYHVLTHNNISLHFKFLYKLVHSLIWFRIFH